MLRGLRTLSDMEYEFTMSLMNLNLDPEIETVFLMAKEAYSHLQQHAAAADRARSAATWTSSCRRRCKAAARSCASGEAADRDAATRRVEGAAPSSTTGRGVTSSLARPIRQPVRHLPPRRRPRSSRAKDRPPATRAEWDARRSAPPRRDARRDGPDAREALPAGAAASSAPSSATATASRSSLFQSRPDVWVTANAYVPEPVKGKVPAVLVVHGHWAGARRDPVVQARCLGLVKLGFFVLAVDAFGAGERYTDPARGTYHGALYGSTLWPAGHTLLGMQVYDNRRAVDYLLHAAGGGRRRSSASPARPAAATRRMYAGALDERFGAVVPVCSVGTYQAYLHAACCVCEVLPGACASPRRATCSAWSRRGR